jgi:hypothetical protein
LAHIGLFRINIHDTFPTPNGLEWGDTLSSAIFYFSLKYVIRNPQENQEGYELNGTHQLLDDADDFNLLGTQKY